MNAILKLWLIVNCMIPYSLLQCQNIVPNGSLEDVNVCDEYRRPCSPAAWFFVQKTGPDGYFHVKPHIVSSGSQYLQLTAAASGSNARSYWQTMLLCRLVVGARYHVTISLAAAKLGPNLNDIGMYFSDKFIFSDGDTMLQPAVYLSFLDAKVKRVKNNWFSVQKDFVATANAQFLILGNFSRDDNTGIIEKRKTRDSLITILADDIFIARYGNFGCPDSVKIKDSLYAIKRRHLVDTVVRKSTLGMPGIRSQINVDTIKISNILFEVNSYTLLHPDSLERYREKLSNPSIKRVQVVGYADDTGSENYNKELSLKRAKEIATKLTNMFAIPLSRIEVQGKGISGTYSEKVLNRRVEIYIHY